MLQEVNERMNENKFKVSSFFKFENSHKKLQQNIISTNLRDFVTKILFSYICHS